MAGENDALLGTLTAASSSGSAPMSAYHAARSSSSSSFRKRVHEFVEGEFDSPFEFFILALIIANVVSFVIGTIVIKGPTPCHGMCYTVNDKYDRTLEIFEFISVVIFTIEYILRVYSCVEDPQWAEKGRFAYMISFFGLIDVCAIAPYWISLFPEMNDVDFTTAIRIFRLIRLLKAEKYVNAFALLGQVLGDNIELLIACFYYSILVLFFFGTCTYYIERHNPDPEIAAHFRSIPEAMYPCLLMLTGEFPLADFSPAGKAITGFMAFVAVAIFAVPTGVIGSGFIQAVQTARHKTFTVDAE